jgi:hypothetical protein
MGIVNRRSCGADDLRIILDLGSQPIANALLLEEELGRPEARYPVCWRFVRHVRSYRSQFRRMSFTGASTRIFPRPRLHS